MNLASTCIQVSSINPAVVSSTHTASVWKLTATTVKHLLELQRPKVTCVNLGIDKIKCVLKYLCAYTVIGPTLNEARRACECCGGGVRGLCLSDQVQDEMFVDYLEAATADATECDSLRNIW